MGVRYSRVPLPAGLALPSGGIPSHVSAGIVGQGLKWDPGPCCDGCGGHGTDPDILSSDVLMGPEGSWVLLPSLPGSWVFFPASSEVWVRPRLSASSPASEPAAGRAGRAIWAPGSRPGVWAW